MDTNMQFTIYLNSFRQLFPDYSLIFSKIPDISLTAVKFPDISRFSRQVVTLTIILWLVLYCLLLQMNNYCTIITGRPAQSAAMPV